MRYRYGDAWERYPIQPGECWRVGNALFLCGDIINPDVAQQLETLLGTEHFIVYSDPPWTPANETAFRTKAGLPKGDFEDFVVAWANLVMDADAIYVEATTTLASDENLYYSTLTLCGYECQRAWNITYYEDRPCLLLWFAPMATECIPPRIEGVQGSDDARTPGIVLGQYESTLVFDPCVGQGLTARAAVNNEHAFIGCELHPRRIAVAIERQAKITGIAPERLACYTLPCQPRSENGFYCMPELKAIKRKSSPPASA